jgi:hypothetical protein
MHVLNYLRQKKKIASYFQNSFPGFIPCVVVPSEAKRRNTVRTDLVHSSTCPSLCKLASADECREKRLSDIFYLKV